MIYSILDFGAVGNGATNDAHAFQAAIDKCSENGGGLVLAPAGQYLCSTILLKSNVELHFELGATIISSHCEEDFPKDMERCFLMGGLHAKNVAITGYGVIDGRGRLVNYNDHADDGFEECPLAFKGFRPRTTYFEDIENLTVKDITFLDSASWTLHMAGCRSVVVDGIRIQNDDRGANNDGIDPDSCRDVVISNCTISTGDDAIVVKTTKAMSALYGPCENITISNCVLHSRDSALKIGTETHGDIRNIIFTGCVARDCSRILGIWMRDGATVENVQVSNIIGSTRRYADANRYPDHWWGKGEPVFISNNYRREPDGAYNGTLRGIFIRNVDAICESSVFMKSGGGNCPIENVRLEQVTLRFKRQGTQPSGVFDESPAWGGSTMRRDSSAFVKNEREVYPHSIPALFAQGINGLYVNGLDVCFEKPEGEAWAELAQIEGCADVDLRFMKGMPAKKELPALSVKNSADVFLAFPRVKDCGKLLAVENSTVETRDF